MRFSKFYGHCFLFFYKYLLIWRGFNIMHSDLSFLHVPSHPPSALVGLPLNKTTFKGKTKMKPNKTKLRRIL